MSSYTRIQRMRADCAAKVRDAVLAIDELVKVAQLTDQADAASVQALHARRYLGQYVSWAEERSRVERKNLLRRLGGRTSSDEPSRGQSPSDRGEGAGGDAGEGDEGAAQSDGPPSES